MHMIVDVRGRSPTREWLRFGVGIDTQSHGASGRSDSIVSRQSLGLAGWVIILHHETWGDGAGRYRDSDPQCHEYSPLE